MLLLGGEYKSLLNALNKIDIVDSGFYFNKTKNEPEKVLENRLKEKIKSMKKKLKKDYDIKYYCAEIELDAFNIHPFYINILIENIIKNIPPEKRMIVELNRNINWEEVLEKSV